METSTLLMIGAGLAVTGGCALAWINFTADGNEDEAIGRLATIGTEPRVAADAFPAALPPARATGGCAADGAPAFFEHPCGAGQAGQPVQPAALARGDHGGKRRGRFYVVK